MLLTEKNRLKNEFKDLGLDTQDVTALYGDGKDCRSKVLGLFCLLVCCFCGVREELGFNLGQINF